MWWLEAAPGGMPSAILALLLTALSLMPFEGLTRKTSTGNSEFIGCLDGSLSLLAGSHQRKKEAAEKSYYDCSVSFSSMRKQSLPRVSTNTRMSTV